LKASGKAKASEAAFRRLRNILFVPAADGIMAAGIILQTLNKQIIICSFTEEPKYEKIG
jgi:hypothetical protein